MQELYNLVGYISDVGNTVFDFFQSIPDMFTQLLTYINYLFIKVKIYFLIKSIEMSFRVAQLLLEDIGFNLLVETAFNALPSELRYYAHLFGIPKALTLVGNCVGTALVMRISRV
ncbi:hypothetical protein MACH09_41650 [Vibrio sp. MACH09]|uniref:DUF2523 domain-containing protein n=1 Tax=Vibrio sp. MACH09 TaxID=3025122 RepID=UPI0027941876|nr:DUF2523 domain-containing protein [Vibrio sp. MACH09]GLO63657.1 hypothetical protein MACH09_41650 [Vibrio sp. MACH09]